MRQIGTFKDARHAQVFADYLLTKGIAAHREENGDEWQIWVRDENKVETAKHELEDFRRNFDADRYREAPRAAQQIREDEHQRRREAAKNLVPMRGQWSQPLSRRAPLVMTLIIVCVAAALFSNLGGNQTGPVMGTLMFCDIEVFNQSGDGMKQIRSGQVWRLATPVILHFGLLHLLFNMYWLYALAPQVEIRKGALKFAGIVITVAVLSNLAQFYLGGMSPNFMGMSGVVYGILGYIWIKQRYDPKSGFILNPSTFQILLFFLLAFWVLDLVGISVFVANWAHAGGLASGMALAYLPLLIPGPR